MLVSFISALNASWLQKNLSVTLTTLSCARGYGRSRLALRAFAARFVAIGTAHARKVNSPVLHNVCIQTLVRCLLPLLSASVRCISFTMPAANT